jgi:ATP-dependent protease ClpP protease subunit
MDVPSILHRFASIQARSAPTAAKATRMGWKIENAAEKAEIYVYDYIGDWGVTAGDFVAELRGVGDLPIDLHINSEGGSVFDGLAIYNALRNHSQPVTAYVDALAASAASFIAMAASKVIIAKNASMMIHDAIGFAMGNAADMRALAELLDESSETIAELYDDHAGGGVSKWRDLMKAETWYRGQAAVDAGLADEVSVPPAKTKNAAVPRVAAQLQTPEPTPITSGLGEALRAARLTTPAPSLQQLIEEHQREPLSAAFGKGA